MKFYTLDNKFIKKSDVIPNEFTGMVEEWSYGTKYWYLNGKIHRIDGPAIEHWDGTKTWYLNDKRHRIDGPAVECVNGTRHWYINNKEVSEEQHKLYVDIMNLKGLI